MGTSQESRTAVVGAAFWMGGALTSFVVLAVAAREVSQTLSTAEIMLFRCIISIPIVAALAYVSSQGLQQLVTTRPGLQIARNLAHFVGQFGWLYAVALIPLAQVFALEFTTPVWVALLAPLVLRERMTTTRAIAALIGFVGVLIIVRPGVLPLSPGATAMLIGAVGFAFSMIATKRLTRTDSPLAILFYMAVVQLPLALALGYSSLEVPSWGTTFWVLIVSLCALSAHFCIARAFLLADAVVVAPMDFLRLPVIAIVGMLLYGETLDLWVLAGGAVIMFANILNVHSERATTRTPAHVKMHDA